MEHWARDSSAISASIFISNLLYGQYPVDKLISISEDEFHLYKFLIDMFPIKVCRIIIHHNLCSLIWRCCIYYRNNNLKFRFFVYISVLVELSLLHLNTPMLKVWISASRAKHPLTSIASRQFPSLRGTTWRNNGSAWNLKRLLPRAPFPHFTRILTSIERVVVNNAMLYSWLRAICWVLSKYPRASSNNTSSLSDKRPRDWTSGFAPTCTLTTKNSRTGSNPLNIMCLWCTNLLELHTIRVTMKVKGSKVTLLIYTFHNPHIL